MQILDSKLNGLVLAAVALTLGACATPVRSTIDADAQADVSAFKTYAWLGDEGYTDADSRSPLTSPLNFQRVRDTVDAVLELKGYTKVDQADADIVLGVTLGTRDRISVRRYYDDLGARYYNFGFSRFGHFGRTGFRRPFTNLAPRARVQTITEGTLAIDIFDNRSRRAIWHGSATRSLSGDENGMKLIEDAVAALIGPLPASSGMLAMLDT